LSPLIHDPVTDLIHVKCLVHMCIVVVEIICVNIYYNCHMHNIFDTRDLRRTYFMFALLVSLILLPAIRVRAETDNAKLRAVLYSLSIKISELSKQLASVYDGYQSATGDGRTNTAVSDNPDSISVASNNGNSLAVSPSSVIFNTLGATFQFNSWVSTTRGTSLPSIVWSSSNPTVATIDRTGLVTARANGNAIITATIPDIFVNAYVTVAIGNSIPIYPPPSQITNPIIPTLPPTLPSPELIPIIPKFNLGNVVQTTVRLNVRSYPALVRGNILGSQLAGAFGTIIGGPVSANGYTWWNIDYANAPDGWSVESYLTSSSLPTLPPFSPPPVTPIAPPPAMPISPPPSGDTQAPTTPTGLSASSVFSSQVNITWNASLDNIGVIGYRIYRNGIQITTTSNTFYSNTGLSPSTTYVYTVAAYDTAGNVSSQSAPISVTTLAIVTPPYSPPIGGGVCEATGLARCWYVAANASVGGSGTFAYPFRRPQDAVLVARPGDFIYLRGGAEFTHSNAANHYHIASIRSEAVSGGPNALITLKSYPGEQAVIRGAYTASGVPIPGPEGGQTTPPGFLAIQITRSHWRIEGLRMFNGVIEVGHNTGPGTGPSVRNVWVVGNTITDTAASTGNFGVISVTGQHTQAGAGTWNDELDPRDIYIHNNTVKTLWGKQQAFSAIQGVLPWYEDGDIEHHACMAMFKSGGYVELVGNNFSECATIFYGKWNGPGPTVMRGNYFHTAQTIAFQWRSKQAIFENNVFARFTRPHAIFNTSQGEVSGIVFRNNVFDLAPWSMNGTGSRGGIAPNESSIISTGNIFFGREPVSGGPVTNSQVDRNCYVWDSSLRINNYPWQQWRTLGWDLSGANAFETNRLNAFVNPSIGNYSSIGTVSAVCGTIGAGI
jgi:hypothetical protein